MWQIDADTFELGEVLELPETHGPWAVAVGGGSVWVSHDRPPSVARFSARTGSSKSVTSRGGGFRRGRVRRGASWTAANGAPEANCCRCTP